MIAIAVLIVLAIIGAIVGGGDDDDDSVRTGADTTDVAAPGSPTSSAAATTDPAEGTTEQPATTGEPERTDPPESTEGPETTEAETTVPETTAEPTTTEPPTTTIPPTTLPPIPSFGSGVQLVGQDVQPGVYATPGADSFGCYFERLSGLSGELDDIIANGNSEGPVIVEILPTDVAFSSSGCERWSAFLGGTPVETFTDGDWAVNQQVAPGRWSAEGDPDGFGCYWERASGFTHTFEEIIANDNTDGRAVVDISPTDVRFTSSGCGTWTRIG